VKLCAKDHTGLTFSPSSLLSCTGDSGGPILNSGGVQVGITSWVSLADEKGSSVHG
jgi:secreted trypsin-like serine protease